MSGAVLHKVKPLQPRRAAHRPRAKRPRSLEDAQRCVVVGDGGGVVDMKGGK